MSVFQSIIDPWRYFCFSLCTLTYIPWTIIQPNNLRISKKSFNWFRTCFEKEDKIGLNTTPIYWYKYTGIWRSQRYHCEESCSFPYNTCSKAKHQMRLPNHNTLSLFYVHQGILNISNTKSCFIKSVKKYSEVVCVF